MPRKSNVVPRNTKEAFGAAWAVFDCYATIHVAPKFPRIDTVICSIFPMLVRFSNPIFEKQFFNWHIELSNPQFFYRRSVMDRPAAFLLWHFKTKLQRFFDSLGLPSHCKKRIFAKVRHCRVLGL